MYNSGYVIGFATPNTIRTTRLEHCFSAGEYASPVRNQSKLTKHVDTVLDKTCRVTTGCLIQTPPKYMYIPISGGSSTKNAEICDHIHRENQTNNGPKTLTRTRLLRNSKETEISKKLYCQFDHYPRSTGTTHNTQMERNAIM